MGNPLAKLLIHSTRHQSRFNWYLQCRRHRQFWKSCWKCPFPRSRLSRSINLLRAGIFFTNEGICLGSWTGVLNQLMWNVIHSFIFIKCCITIILLVAAVLYYRPRSHLSDRSAPGPPSRSSCTIWISCEHQVCRVVVRHSPACLAYRIYPAIVTLLPTCDLQSDGELCWKRWIILPQLLGTLSH